METKPTILFVIDDLGRGGAETLLVGLMPVLSARYNIILVSLSSLCEFSDDALNCTTRYSLNNTSKWTYGRSIRRLKKIIKKHNPQLIHAHLLNSSIIARLSAPSNIPFVHTLHSILSETAFKKSWVYRNLEKLLFKKQHQVLAVSQAVLDDYENYIGKPNKKKVLWNFVSDVFFGESNSWKKSSEKPIKLVAVGNIKEVKNYEYLCEALAKNAQGVQLDIFGKNSELSGLLEAKIKSLELPIKLQGQTDHIENLLKNYDYFVMPSKNEGFGIAAVEAMAVGLPLLLSDIKVLRDISFGNAHFFDLSDPGSFLAIIEKIKNGEYSAESMSIKGKSIARAHYSKQSHLSQLYDVYDSLLNTPKP